MSIPKGLIVSDLVARVLVDVSDPNQRRWSSDQVTKFLNEGVRELAGEGIFRRSDIHVPSSGQSFYATMAEAHRIRAVMYDGRRLAAGRALHSKLATIGLPAAYVAEKDGVSLHPAPPSPGTAITFNGLPPLSEVEGGKLNGDGYTAAWNNGAVSHFKAGDGHAPDAFTAPNNVRIDYSYYPRPFESSDTIPSRYADALVVYATWRCFNLSQVPEEVTRAQVLAGLWHVARDRSASAAGAGMLTEETVFAPMEAL